MRNESKRAKALKRFFLIIIALGVVIGLGWAIFSGGDEPAPEVDVDELIDVLTDEEVEQGGE